MTKEELKNCPNCGGVLDDTGRCMYCNSKVYDLTDINIDLDTRDVLKMKLKFNGHDVIMYCYPINAEFEFQQNYESHADCMGSTHYFHRNPDMMVKLELQSTGMWTERIANK